MIFTVTPNAGELQSLKQAAGQTGWKLILVTAINPTLPEKARPLRQWVWGDAPRRLGKRAVMPCVSLPGAGIGISRGAAGGGYAQVVPMEDINLSFYRRPACHWSSQ